MSTTTLAPAARTIRSGGTLTGTGRLLRFALRRDRIRLPAWVLGIALTLGLTAAAFPGVYPDAAARQARALLMGNPATVALAGPQIGVADYTFGAMMTNELLSLTSIVVALMSIFTVVRHTRGEEESGRSELVLANPVGRYAPLATGLAMAGIANLALAVVTAVILGAQGLDSITWSGSWLYAAALVSVGFVFAGVAAVTAQISQHARSASSMAGLVLGVAYTIRAIGDVTNSGVVWLSPFAWAQRTYAYVNDQWWPLLLSAALTAVLTLLAVRLNARRDSSAGLREPRPGPATGSPRLSTSLALALHNQRVALTAWTVSLGLFGLIYGTLLADVEGFAEEMSVTIADVLGGTMGESLINAFLAVLVVVMSILATVYALVALLRARSEENSGLAENILATPTSRSRFLAGHITVAIIGGVLVLLAGVLGLGVTGSLALSDVGVLGRLLAAGLVQAAPLIFLVSVAVALFGLSPGLARLCWIPLVYGVVTTTVGGVLGLPQWALDLSPWSMVPMLPSESFRIWPVLGMLVVSGLLFALGFWGFRRRDVQTVA